MNLHLSVLKGVHHIAIICSDYERSKDFYTRILGLEVIRETYRDARKSYKLDLALNGSYTIELFSFPDPPSRPTQPESTGLRHLAFSVHNLADALKRMKDLGVRTEAIRTDEITGKKFAFIFDPDNLPLEFYED